MRITFLVVLLTFFSDAIGQSYTQYAEFADEKMVEGDYYYALKYYEKAMDFDSSSVEILWKYAEANRKYKDYPKAEYYYAKVYAKEGGKIYPKSIFWLASMQHINGKYDESLENWKRAKKVFKKDRKGYEYKKAQAEIISCLWAKKAIMDTTDFQVDPIGEPINSKDAELAPFIYQNKLYFTSLKADSINFGEEVYSDEYSLQIYTSEQQDSLFNQPLGLKSVHLNGYHSANGSFSPDGSRFYFTRCNANYSCKIFVGKVNGDQITEIDSLGEIINESGAITTMPHVALIEGNEYLFFASNREKTQGGLDIWYSLIRNGNQYSKPRNLGRGVNSQDDETSPFYDPIEKKLYFSSSWHPGFGGLDIFYCTNNEMRFMNPVNLGIPINSQQNDTYFTIDTSTNNYYFSSNRIGVNYAKNPTCCNDIFIAYLPITEPPTRFESLEDLNKKLPVTLYFHNDEPDPKTRDTTTNLTYIESYSDYIGLKDKYKKEYSQGLSGDEGEEAKEDIDDFFVEYVEQGVKDLDEFIRLLIIELDKGYQIEVTVKGFASPLAKTDYNVNLTKRRISSLINYLRMYEDGRFIPYLDGTAENGGLLTFVQVPFGEYTADNLISDNPNDQKHSIYSRSAALERKIEIQSVSLISQDSSYAEMKFNKEVHDFGESAKGKILTYTFKFTNTGDETLVINEIEFSCDCMTAILSGESFEPGASGTITISLNTAKLNGLTAEKITLSTNLKQVKKELTITTEVN